MFKVYSSISTVEAMNYCQVFFTNFPYYLRDGDESKFDVDVKSLHKDSDFYKSLSWSLQRYTPDMDPHAVDWVRSVLIQVILRRFSWYNDDCSPTEAVNARDDIQFILIQSPVGNGK